MWMIYNLMKILLNVLVWITMMRRVIRIQSSMIGVVLVKMMKTVYLVRMTISSIASQSNPSPTPPTQNHPTQSNPTKYYLKDWWQLSIITKIIAPSMTEIDDNFLPLSSTTVASTSTVATTSFPAFSLSKFTPHQQTKAKNTAKAKQRLIVRLPMRGSE